jgi:aspartate/methionine/tyrosine aminotransferase
MEAIMALCAPSDEVVIPVPAWVSYAEMATLVGATAVCAKCGMPHFNAASTVHGVLK